MAALVAGFGAWATANLVATGLLAVGLFLLSIWWLY